MSIRLRTLFSEFMLVSAGKVISLGAQFACGVVVARFAGPAEFGRFSAALLLVLLLDVVIGGPLDYAAVRFSALHRDDPERVVRFHGAAFRTKVVFALLLVIVAVAARSPLTTLLFNAQESRNLVLWCVGSTVSLVLLRSTFAWLQTGMRFKQYASLDTLHGTLRVVAMIAVGLAGLRSAEGFLGVFAGAAVGTYLGSLVFISQPYIFAPRVSRDDARAVLGYIGATAAVLILGSFTGRSDVFFVRRLVSPEAAGLYASASQISSIITMFASYACLILQPRLLHAGAASISRLTWLSVAAGCAAAVVLVPAFYWGGALGLERVFGAQFRSASPILTVLMVGASLDLVIMPVLMMYALQTRARAAAFGELAIASVYFGLILAFGSQGVLVVAWIATATRALKLGLYAWLALSAPPVPGVPAAPIAGSSA